MVLKMKEASRRGGFVRSVVLAGMVWVLSIATAAQAALMNVGQIDVDRYMAMGNGVEITAHFTTNAAFNDQTCCRAEDLRWIQRVSTTRRTGFSPPPADQVPPRPFIDPRNGQDIGGGTMGDNLPFYDVTYAMDPVTNPATPLVQNGSGRFIYDKPQLNAATSRPNTFCAETLLVCLKPGTMMMAILGGFSWGFDINADGSTVTPKATMALSDTMATRDAFNTALGLDFPGWSIISGADAWPDLAMPLGVRFVPTPGAGLVAGFAVLSLTARRRRAA